ncbi:hypothetical protein BDAP_000031 [Binucleata daphniae]
MAVTKINLHSKLLYVLSHNNAFYISSFSGQVCELSWPFNVPKRIININEPISCFIINKDVIVSATWNGNIYKNNSKILNLGNFIIKAMCMYQNKIYIAVDTYLYVLNAENYKIERTIDCNYKILCMGVVCDVLYFGCGIPMLAKWDNGFSIVSRNEHCTSILAISNLNNKIITGSADGTVRCNSKVIYKSEGWIRSLLNEYIADDKKLIKDEKVICTHDDYITGLARVNETVACIGLDGYVSIIGDIACSTAEEDEIESFMKNYK